MKVQLADAAATRAFGGALASALAQRAGLVIYLRGELGAGKTTLARGLLYALGVRHAIRSPTYTLMEVYGIGGRNILHLDLYRLADPLEIANLGLGDFPPQENWWLIEWPERGAPALPPPDLELHLSGRGEGRVLAMEIGAGVDRSALRAGLAGAAASIDDNLHKE